MAAKIAQVLFPLPVPGSFDYEVPLTMSVAPGQFVVAPLGNQQRTGVVWSVGEAEGERKLKPVTELIHAPTLPESTRKFADWMAGYTCAPVGMVLRMILRAPQALYPPPDVTVYRPSGKNPDNLTPSRARILDLKGIWPARAADIARLAEVSPGVVSGLAKAGGLVKSVEPLDRPYKRPDPDRAGISLTESQRAAAKELVHLVETRKFAPALLDGVTGSGKTEVYFEAIAAALQETDAQVLVLIPEIALTQAGIRRIEERFGARPVIWHSAQSEASRRRAWREVHHGRARLVVGARSALFLPFQNLRCIIVDEEHDSSYKQEEGVIYNARDMAVARAKFEKAAVILASATPSLETLVNARGGRYAHTELPERPGTIQMPAIDLIDMREEERQAGRFISPTLEQAVRDNLEAGDQTLLYLNRRGYAPMVICRACGHRLRSPDTDSWLVEHRRSDRLVCHLTGYSIPRPVRCPECGEKNSLAPVGPGVERIEEEVLHLFPAARTEVMSSDTMGNPDKIRSLIRRMAEGHIDILIGTQMVAKGHNFPHLTLVGVVDGDLSLAGGDMRAGEQTWQMLNQVAGRAGRKDKPGRALIQTHMPEHEAFQALASGDRERFISAELEMRKMLELPPFGRLAALIISAPDAEMVEKAAEDLRRAIIRVEGVQVMGPTDPPIAVLRGRHRRRFLVQAPRNFKLSSYMRDWTGKVSLPTAVKVQIDIDPQSFF